MLSLVLLGVIVFLAVRVSPREHPEHAHKHGAGQIGLLAALALFGVDYFTSYYYASGEMMSALHPYGLQRYAYIAVAVIAFANFVFGSLYMYSLGIFNEGGGSYTASMRYLWPTLSLIVAVTLIQDYVLTIVVSALSGADQLLSILNAYDSNWLWHFGIGAVLAAITWYLTIRGRGDSARVVFVFLATFALLTITLGIGLAVALWKGVPAVPSAAQPHPVSLARAALDMLTASMKGMVALTGLEAVSNGIQFMIEEDPGFVKWGRQHIPRLKRLWDFYAGRPGIARFVQTSFLFYGGLTTLFLTYFSIHFNVFDGTLGRTLVGNLAYIGFTQLPGGEILFWAYQILAVGMLAAASMTAFQDAQATEWRDVAIGEIPEAIIYRDRRGTFTRSVTITFGISVLLMFLVRGQTTVAVPFYGVAVFMPITVMGLAVRQHILEHFSGRTRVVGSRLAGFAAALAITVFIGQLVGKWDEGGWVALVSFSALALAAHSVLLSPAGYREARQVSRIVHDKARVEGSMASIVKWQAFKMQEYRFRLMLALSSILELFGVTRMAPRTLAAVVVGGGSMAIHPNTFEARPPEPAVAEPTRARPAAMQLKKTSGAFEARDYRLPPPIVRHRILVPVTEINQGTLTALRYAHSLSSDVTAVHVAVDRQQTENLRRLWPIWGEGVRLVVLDSPHKMVLEPLLEYIQELMALRRLDEILTVVVPQSIRPRWWSNLARTQMGVLLRLSLPFEAGIVITDVPYLLDGDENEADGKSMRGNGRHAVKEAVVQSK
jgi:hypothetical protein